MRLRFRLRAIAFRQRPHMVLGRWKEGSCFYIFFTGVDPVRVLGHGPVLGVVAVVDLGWSSGGGAAHGRSPSPIFVDRGHCIGVRDVANTSAPSTLLSIFIEQIQPLP